MSEVGPNQPRPYLPPKASDSVNGELFGGPFDGCVMRNYVIGMAVGWNHMIGADVMVPYTDDTIVEVFTPTAIRVLDARRRQAFYAHDGSRWNVVKTTTVKEPNSG